MDGTCDGVKHNELYYYYVKGKAKTIYPKARQDGTLSDDGGLTDRQNDLVPSSVASASGDSLFTPSFPPPTPEAAGACFQRTVCLWAQVLI